MSDRIRSGIFFHGSRMRYAEIEQAQPGAKLLRLGSCDFDFDAENAILSGDSSKLGTVKEALGDVFSGSRSGDFSVVLTPGSVTSFFSPVSDRIPEEEKRSQLEADTILIGGKESALSVVAEPIGSSRARDEDEDEDVTWYHVAAVPASIKRHVNDLLSVFPDARTHFMTAMQAAARVAGRIEEALDGEQRHKAAALLGRFAGHTEVSIMDSAEWRFGVTVPSTLPADLAYAILNIAREVDIPPERLVRIYVYGESPEDSDLETVSSLSSAQILKLDPLSLVRNDPVAVRSSFDPNLYVLCVGGAL